MTNRWLLIAIIGGAIALTMGGLALGSRAKDPLPEPGSGFGAGPVTAATPLTRQWAAVVDGLGAGIDPASPNACKAGRPECLDAVLAEMEARLARIGCGHAAPFAFTYLEMTKGVERRVDESELFGDPRAIAHLDALFAQLYFDAFDNWAAGRRDQVPGAWQMAFAAADAETASAAADVLLGMNAHISRDLAYSVAAMLEQAPEATANTADFALVNGVIAEVKGPLLLAAAERFDPSLAELEAALVSDSSVDATTLISVWRQRSFDLGRRLAEAPTADAKRAVETEIERVAVASAAAILNGDASTGGCQLEAPSARPTKSDGELVHVEALREAAVALHAPQPHKAAEGQVIEQSRRDAR